MKIKGNSMRQYLRELREELGCTQLEISKKLNISESYYSLIENGERQKKLDMTMAKKLADIFGVTLEFIYDHEREVS